MNRKDIDTLWFKALRISIEKDDDFTRYEFAALIEQHLIASGYRKCAEGQRITQYCCMVEEAVKAERETWPNLEPVITWLENDCNPQKAAEELRLYAKAIRARGKA